MESTYQDSGKIRDDYLPAMYCDSSFLIEYWIAESLEGSNIFEELGIEQHDNPYSEFILELLRSNVRTEKVFEIRNKNVLGSRDIWLVTSPLSTIEMIEWKAEASLKQIIAEKVSAIAVQRRGKKDIGDYLKKILDSLIEEQESEKSIGKNGIITGFTPPMKLLHGDTSMNSSYFSSHALHGIGLLDLQNFELTMKDAWTRLWPFAYCQIGLADCLHLLAAHHLGCEYFASFDQDFKRVRDFAKDEFGIEILCSPEQILEVMNKAQKR